MLLSLKFYAIFLLHKYKLQVKAQVKVIFKMSRKWIKDKFINLKLKLIINYYSTENSFERLSNTMSRWYILSSSFEQLANGIQNKNRLK